MAQEPTRVASSDRASNEDLQRQAAAVRGVALLKEVLATVPDLVLVVNQQRQVVFANHALAEFVHQTQGDLVGQRPGEIVGCVNADNASGGCGTTVACRTCGILGAILSAAQGDSTEREARLATDEGAHYDLRVKSTRISVGDDHLTVVSLTDVGHEKRRRVLERVFFHDVLNTAGGVQGLAGLIRESDEGQRDMLTGLLEASASQLVEEIQSQRLLTSVEGGEYVLSPEPYAVGRVLAEVVGAYVALAQSNGVTLEVAGRPAALTIETDRAMLGRVLGNLVKNAVEASASGSVVQVGAERTDQGVTFWVHNESDMPREAQLQVFQRSFSTKGANRGIGTYSVKLFTESYLQGSVGFESDPDHGTTFRVRLPLSLA